MANFKVALTTDTACFNTDLRLACRIIAIASLVWIAISSIITTSYFTSASTLLGFIFTVVANVALYFGAHKENQWLVLVWLIQAIFIIIGWPIAVLGVIFNYGDYRRTAHFNNVILMVLEYIIILVIFLLVARIVYSYWVQLRSRNSNPQHSVVV